MEAIETVNTLADLAEARVYISALKWHVNKDGTFQLPLKGYSEFEADYLMRGLAEQKIHASQQAVEGESYKILVVDSKDTNRIGEIVLEGKLAIADAKYQAYPSEEGLRESVESQEAGLRYVRSINDKNQSIASEVVEKPLEAHAGKEGIASNALTGEAGWLGNNRGAHIFAEVAESGAKKLALVGLGYAAYSTTQQARELVIADKPLEAANLVGENVTKLTAGFAAAMPAAQATAKLIPGPVGKVVSIGTALAAGYAAAKAVDEELDMAEYFSTQIRKQLAVLGNETLDDFMSKNLIANGVPADKVESTLAAINKIRHGQDATNNSAVEASVLQ